MKSNISGLHCRINTDRPTKAQLEHVSRNRSYPKWLRDSYFKPTSPIKATEKRNAPVHFEGGVLGGNVKWGPGEKARNSYRGLIYDKYQLQEAE